MSQFLEYLQFEKYSILYILFLLFLIFSLLFLFRINEKACILLFGPRSCKLSPEEEKKLADNPRYFRSMGILFLLFSIGILLITIIFINSWREGFKMSWLKCLCGEIIHDNTDRISCKAKFIADQDYDDYLDEVEKECTEKIPTDFERFLRDIFQCPNCGNLMIFSPDCKERYDFKAMKPEKSKGITKSFLGDKWKGSLTGLFRGESYPLEDERNKGDLFWETNQSNGSAQDLSLEDLQKMYYEKLEDLQNLGILRSSILNVAGKTEHQWEYKKEED